MISVYINGRDHSYEEPISLSRLINNLNIPSGSVAIERNLEFVERNDWDDTMISDGDKIELIRPFSGG